MSNRKEMILLCEKMVKAWSNSDYIFSGMNKIIWEGKLNYWKSLKI